MSPSHRIIGSPALTLVSALAMASGLAAGSCSKAPELVAPEPGLERMIIQQRATPYRGDPIGGDAMGMRSPPPGTVSREAMAVGPATTGLGPDGYLMHAPFAVDAAFIHKGQDRFAVACSACHGLLGNGDSVVADNMGLVRPRNLHDPRIRRYPVGRIFQVITDGYGLMASHADILSNRDRWAVAVYVKVLQLSQHADLASLPADVRASLTESPP